MSKKKNKTILIQKIRNDSPNVLEDNEGRLYTKTESEMTSRLIESGEIDAKKNTFHVLIALPPKEGSEFPLPYDEIKLNRYLSNDKVGTAKVLFYLKGKHEKKRKIAEAVLEINMLSSVS